MNKAAEHVSKYSLGICVSLRTVHPIVEVAAFSQTYVLLASYIFFKL